MKDDQVQRVHERLAAAPGLRPVSLGGGRRFGLWDLASLAEGALGVCVDPDSLTVSIEKRLRARLGTTGREHRYDEDFCRRYWIWQPGGERGPVGTIAVATWPSGSGALHVSSLSVHPVARRQGLASAALDTVYEACRAEELHGFRLATYWTWQRTVRYYLGRGLWVTSWKDALGLARLSYLPRYEVRESEGELVFLASPGDDSGADLAPLLVAGDTDGRLVLRETEQYRHLPDRLDAVRRYARSTLALHLAVRGRPLVRGEEERDRAHRSCDIGEPEGLAYKIGVFERVAREEGWRVDTPLPESGGAPAAPDADCPWPAGNSDAGAVVHVIR
ncbi:GNAT family N-acetyltransferase [Streptomyces sp. W16]|uniref:GNAT family N-acetyltransferase n=1 Tax=Streptomyces sp. W16 TaxID=3076631 RepID=UPI00295AF6E8|nr:GNAT family N-acetyltransferase [Streptomyces sp. W16]MDV9178169.1 GNAT family N-acetyltransferase [Streptomyces sp. W16]